MSKEMRSVILLPIMYVYVYITHTLNNRFGDCNIATNFCDKLYVNVIETLRL